MIRRRESKRLLCMSASEDEMRRPAVLIYGATGRTGRATAERLGQDGARLIVAGRDAAGLRALAASWPSCEARVAAVSPAQLHAAMAGCTVAIQCAALAEAEAHVFVAAAIQAGVHVIDVAAERDKVEALARTHGLAAHRRGVALCSGVAPIGGALGEWLGIAAARRALAGREDRRLDALTIAYASDSLPPSTGSWSSSLSMVGRRPTGGWGARIIDFPPPFGRLPAFGFALGGTVALAARYTAAKHRCYAAFAFDAAGRRRHVPRIAVLAEARACDLQAAVAFSGAAPYEITARMLALVVDALACGDGHRGVVQASELVDPVGGLAALEQGLGRVHVRDAG